MLRPRIIPVLLIRNGGLVKTTKFKDDKYVGDPLNAVRIFNEKAVDEIVVLDIDATSEQREPDYQLIGKIADECRMPLCYGGGVKTPQQAKRIIGLGVEKVALSSAILEDPTLCASLADAVGQQSVVAVLDVKRTLLGGYDVYTHNGKRKTKQPVVKWIAELQDAGVGEFVINSVDRDGCQNGYDETLVDKVRPLVDTPLTILGGASSMQDISKLIEKHGVIGCAAGSLFVFRGKYRAVLISYPSFAEKYGMIKASLSVFGAK